MGAAIIGDPILPQPFGVFDVRVPARNRVVRRAVAFRERHVVRSDEPMAAVANLCVPSEIDARERECVDRFFRRSIEDGDLQRRRRCGFRSPRLSRCNAIELDVKLGRRPVRLRPRDKRACDMHPRWLTPGITQACRDSVVQLRIAVENGLQTCAGFSRAGDDRHLDPVERENVRSPPCRLHSILDRIDDPMHNLERLARARLRPSLCRAVERSRDARFQLPCFTQDVHRSFNG